MKLRCDFVTNSSSSSFILARKGPLTEKQKRALIAYIEHEFLGERILAPGATSDEIDRVDEVEYLGLQYYEGRRDTVVRALAKDCEIYSGEVCFDGTESIADVYERIWSILEKNADDESDFLIIDGDLSY